MVANKNMDEANGQNKDDIDEKFNVSIRALSQSTKTVLSSLLNPKKIFTSEIGYLR